jgi:CheY-like chemotaxis protein
MGELAESRYEYFFIDHGLKFCTPSGIFDYKIAHYMLVAYAEDDIDDFNTVAEVLSEIDSSIECINASNGLELLDILESGTVLPDVILLDFNMPAMDGKSCLKAIRADERFHGVPVYVYSTGANPRDEAHCLELGATDYIKKQTSIVAMRNFLHELVVMHR